VLRCCLKPCSRATSGNGSARAEGGKGKWLATALVLCWCGGQGIHIWADATAYTPVLGFTRYMPVYFPMKATRRLAKMGLIDPEAVEQARLLRKAGTQDSGQLRYPLNPLSCTADSAGLPNILFVVIDALRPDRISPENTPYIATFAAQALEFRDHYSGGNSSRMGFFSMFYGLPSTYWQAFNDTQRQPVLMDQLAARGYEITGFSSVGFGSPSRIDRTLFAAVDPKSLHTLAREGDRNVDHPRLASVVQCTQCTGAAVVQPALLRSRQRGQRHRREHGGAAHAGRAGSCLHAWHQGHRS
jgi:membrane-anchored protein YejM (alkaline phosphatase superfamily)